MAWICPSTGQVGTPRNFRLHVLGDFNSPSRYRSIYKEDTFIKDLDFAISRFVCYNSINDRGTFSQASQVRVSLRATVFSPHCCLECRVKDARRRRKRWKRWKRINHFMKDGRDWDVKFVVDDDEEPWLHQKSRHQRSISPDVSSVGREGNRETHDQNFIFPKEWLLLRSARFGP